MKHELSRDKEEENSQEETAPTGRLLQSGCEGKRLLRGRGINWPPCLGSSEASIERSGVKPFPLTSEDRAVCLEEGDAVLQAGEIELM